MEKASAETRYEDAAHYRDQVKLLEKNLDEQMFITPGTKDRDIVGFYREGQDAEFSVLFSRGGILVDKAEYSFKNTAGTDEELLGGFLSQFYGGNRFIPNEIIIPVGIEGMEELSEWLSEKLGRKAAISVPEGSEGFADRARGQERARELPEKARPGARRARSPRETEVIAPSAETPGGYRVFRYFEYPGGPGRGVASEVRGWEAGEGKVQDVQDKNGRRPERLRHYERGPVEETHKSG
jgi:hypothetical protein